LHYVNEYFVNLNYFYQILNSYYYVIINAFVEVCNRAYMNSNKLVGFIRRQRLKYLVIVLDSISYLTYLLVNINN
jgi:hypothetical protein